MKELSIERINEVASYKVTSSCKGVYTFVSAHGVKYKAGFLEDSLCGESIESYQFYIANESDESSPGDLSLWKTIDAIIAEFFRVNNLVMVYLCEYHDGKAEARMRLFERKFKLMHYGETYAFKPYRTYVEDVPYIGALIFRKDHPDAHEISNMVDETMAWVNNKPSA